MNKSRIIIGILVAPVIFIISWSIPYYEHSAFHKWVVINTVHAYVTFLILASISHLILKILKWSTLLQYCLVIFFVGVIISIGFSIWSLQGYSELFYAQTKVVNKGSITVSGYILKAKEALLFGMLSMVGMTAFWFIVWFKTKGAKYA